MAHELGRKQEPVAEDLDKRVNVLAIGDAAQQHDLAGRPGDLVKTARVAVEREAIAGIGRIDGSGSKLAQTLEINERLQPD